MVRRRSSENASYTEGEKDSIEDQQSTWDCSRAKCGPFDRR